MQRWRSDFASALRPPTRAGLSALLLVLPLLGTGLGACGGSGDDPPDPPVTPADAAGDALGDVTVDTNDSEAPDAGNDAAPDSGGDAGECVPKTCSTLGANCGSAPDGCGCDQPGQSLYSYDYCGPDEAYCGPSPNEKCFVQCLHAYDGWVNCDGVCGP